MLLELRYAVQLARKGAQRIAQLGHSAQLVELHRVYGLLAQKERQLDAEPAGPVGTDGGLAAAPPFDIDRGEFLRLKNGGGGVAFGFGVLLLHRPARGDGLFKPDCLHVFADRLVASNDDTDVDWLAIVSEAVLPAEADEPGGPGSRDQRLTVAEGESGAGEHFGIQASAAGAALSGEFFHGESNCLTRLFGQVTQFKCDARLDTAARIGDTGVLSVKHERSELIPSRLVRIITTDDRRHIGGSAGDQDRVVVQKDLFDREVRQSGVFVGAVLHERAIHGEHGARSTMAQAGEAGRAVVADPGVVEHAVHLSSSPEMDRYGLGLTDGQARFDYIITDLLYKIKL